MLSVNTSILRYIIGSVQDTEDTQTQAELTLLEYKYNSHILRWEAIEYGQDINFVLLSVLPETHPGPHMVAIMLD